MLAQYRYFGLISILIIFLNTPKPAFPQKELPFEADPYIDSEVKKSNITQSFQNNEGFLIGMLYGLHPALVFSPALSLGYLKEPFTVGIEISDSDRLEFWSNVKKERLGPSRFGGSTIFAKFFFVQNIYLMIAYEKRFAHLTNLYFDRPDVRPGFGGEARFKLFAESTVGSIGLGFMNYGKKGFMAIDLYRMSKMINQKAQTNIIWETWSSNKHGGYESFQEDIQSQREDWYNTLNSHSALLITAGLFFD